MKKTYFVPSTLDVKIKATTFLCGSNGLGKGANDPTEDPFSKPAPVRKLYV